MCISADQNFLCSRGYTLAISRVIYSRRVHGPLGGAGQGGEGAKELETLGPFVFIPLSRGLEFPGDFIMEFPRTY